MFSLIFVDAWNHMNGEAVTGGRTIEKHTDLDEALAAYYAWRLAAPRAYGPGVLVITDPDGARIFPTRQPAEQEEVTSCKRN